MPLSQCVNWFIDKQYRWQHLLAGESVASPQTLSRTTVKLARHN